MGDQLGRARGERRSFSDRKLAAMMSSTSLPHQSCKVKTRSALIPYRLGRYGRSARAGKRRAPVFFRSEIGGNDVEHFVATPELQSENSIGTDPLPSGQVWAISSGGQEESAGLFQIGNWRQ